MLSRVLRALIMGPPGSGKGTIAERIITDFDMTHISSGDLLRVNILKKTAVGLKVKKYIDNGMLVPDDIMVDLAVSALAEHKNKNWLLDGFPRTLGQAEALHTSEPIDLVVDLNVPFDVIIERINGRLVHMPSGRVYHTEFNPPKVAGKDDVTGEELHQRDDDKPETVLARLQSYQKQTEPVIEYYRSLGILEEFKGNKSNELWPKVHKFLASKMEPKQYTEYK